MIRFYSGEYLKTPIGLHLMLNPCSYGCYYCFAKMGKIKGMNFDAIYREFAKLEGDPGRSIAKYLFQKKATICISNTTDPFCHVNAQGFEELADWMTAKEINFILQTRGGARFKEVLKKIKPTMIYFSITSDRDEITKTREPGTPSFEERVEFIRYAKETGHMVVLGLNPYMPDWWQDVRGFAKRLQDMGITHIWTEPMHLTGIQSKSMPPVLKDRYQAEVTSALSRNSPDKIKLRALVRVLDLMGFNVLSSNLTTKLHYWDDFFKLGYPFMPTLDGFMSHCLDRTGGRPIRFTFDYFDRWADVFDGFDSSQFHEYLKPFRRTLYKHGVSENVRNVRELHDIFWNILDYPTPLRCDDIAYSFVSLESGKEEAEFDRNDRNVLAFARCHDEIAIEREGLELLDI